MKIGKQYLFTGVVALILLSACSGYNKLLKSTNDELRYQSALKYYNKKDYGRAVPLLESLVMPYNGTKRDDTVRFYLAKGYMGQLNYYLAAYQFENFCKSLPRSPFIQEAYYSTALCYYKESYRYELDQANTMRAINAFDDYIDRYPTSNQNPDVQKYVTELSERLDEKAFYGAKLYYNLDNYKAAVVALRNSIKEYPESKYREEQMFLILKSSYLYAKNSIKERQRERYIAAVDEYLNFVAEYPQSSYSKEAESMYKDASKYIDKHKPLEEKTLNEE